MSNYIKDGDRIIEDAFGGNTNSFGQKPKPAPYYSYASCPTKEIVQKRPSYVVLNVPGVYAFLYETTSSAGGTATEEQYATGSAFGHNQINVALGAGAKISASSAPIRLDVNPVGWRRDGAQGAVGDVTFVYVRTR